MRLVDTTIQVNAPADLLYELLTDAEHLVRWMAATAEIDARVGGTIRWTHENGDTCSGRFVELVPARRIVFTYGWERPDVQVPPGSTTVEITLEPRGDATRLRLVHRGLAGPMADAHAGGWDNYLGRLAAVAEGRDPGPDPLAGERVPSAADLGLP
ncbi:MAG TPA: SRPBCC family protein [Acidimicrobiales bacterium]